MSKFTDALNNPLPSKANLVAECGDDMMNNGYGSCYAQNEDADCIGGYCKNHADMDDTDVDGTDVSDVDDTDDDFDPDDLSDEQLAELDRQLSGDALDSVVDDSDNQVHLTPDEEVQADDMMSMAATTLLVNDELNAQEKAEFVRVQGATAVSEGFMTQTDVNELAQEAGLVEEAKYTNKMIIRLDAESKKKQLYALAVNVSAAAHQDPDYVKLKKVMKMRKILRAKLERKYHSEATKRMKIYFNRLKHSKSNTLSNIGNKYNK